METQQERIDGLAAHLQQVADAASTEDGKYNERSGGQQPSLPLLMFGSFGIDRYNANLYLRKFKSDQLQDMLRAFRGAADVVEQALQESLHMDEFSKEYTPLHPALHTLVASDFIEDKLLAALSKASPGKLMRIVEEEAPDIYSFQVLKPELCQQLLDEIDHFNEYQARHKMVSPLLHPTEMSKKPLSGQISTAGRPGYTVLDELGLTSLLDELLSRVMAPLARLLYAEAVGGSTSGSTSGSAGGAAAGSGSGSTVGDRFASLDWRHGYVISYSDAQGQHGKRTRLLKHTDDSELTLNICLGRTFKGGAITFGGKRGSTTSATLLRSQSAENGNSRSNPDTVAEAIVFPTPGRAVVHLGQHIHEVQPVLEGERHMLIMWCRSSQYRAVCCPCCTINRRGDECVCSPQWRGRYVGSRQ
jgi:hypothetical protein